MKKIKSLIIGLGNIGMDVDYENNKKRLSHSSTIYHHRKFELIGGADIKKIQRKKFEKKYKKKSFKNYLDAIKITKPDLIVISTPPNTHLEIINNLGNFKKIILLEKPLSNNFKQAKRIASLINKKKLNVFINYFREYIPAFINIINTKSKLYHQCHINYSSSLRENGSHHLSLLMNIFDNKKKIINIKSLKKGNKTKDAIINFSNGEIILVSNKIKNYEINNVKIINKNSFTELQLNPISIKASKIINDSNFKNGKVLCNIDKYSKEIKDNFFKHVYENIYNYINGKKFYKIPIEKVLRTEKLIDEIEKV